MESHEVIRRALEKRGPKEIASEMGVSLSMVYKWAEPKDARGSGSRNPLDRVDHLRELTGDPGLLQWLCQRAEGYFVRNPKSYCEEGYEVIPSTNEIVRQFSGLLSAISRAAADDSISVDEAKRIRAVWERLKGFAEGFVRCCEEGDFDQIRHGLRGTES
ncbi:MAG TPA: phage regulatory CII family protein [Verrucomicrobiales bacterium]|nr:phage regulatory CII family protein [Verrucomicrobiales bacterium]